MTPAAREYQHPFPIRATHWVNFIALGIMVTSGLRIYNASPIWEFSVPAFLTLGGWLAGARMWHFFGMWLFVANGVVWVSYNLLTLHGRQTTLFRPSDAAGVLPMILYYIRLRKVHPAAGKYNALQKLAYTTIPLAGIGSLVSGLAIYWPVQLSGIAALMGGYDTARVWHFVCACAFVVFFCAHVLMVAIAGWPNFVSMITGWKRTPGPSPPAPP